MKKLICLICPAGCIMEAGGEAEEFSVTGNLCPRGAVYAQEEIRSPKRIVTATAAIEGGGAKGKDCGAGFIRRVPVRTTVPCPREKIPALLRDIYKLKVSLPVSTGDVLIAGWNGAKGMDCGADIDVIATRRIG